MKENFEMELQQEIDFMYEQLGFIQTELMAAERDKDTKEYARLMRLYLPMQKNYLKMCAELRKISEAVNAAEDPLLAFAGSAQELAG